MCSLAQALDRVGERWSLLIVRELDLGPLRFSDLARQVGEAPTDILTRRLRDLEGDGVVRRRELGPPVSATVYELTEVGRGLERPILELARWGLNFYRAGDVAEMAPSLLPSALRVILVPQPDAPPLALDLRTGEQTYRLHIEDGWINSSRGESSKPDLILCGEPIDVIATLLSGEPGDRGGAVVEGDVDALDRLRGMVVIPDRLRTEVEAML